jgi:leucyl-tRNA synthetase
MITEQTWPEYDEAKTVKDSVEIAVQVNGKLRGTFVIARGEDGKSAMPKIRASFDAQLAGKTVVKEIFVPDKLANFVVK